MPLIPFESSNIVGSCLNCTTPANLFATLAMILIGVGLAVRFEGLNHGSDRIGVPVQ